VATGRSKDLNETFRILKKVTGYLGQPNYGPERAGDVKHSRADISKAEKYLGYKPGVDFEQGLKNTVDWYKTQLDLAAELTAGD
jgi:nucleoside-diphosphate-sugar epimerase